MLSGKAKVRNVERCGLCNEVTRSVDLYRFGGVCFYCNLDTNADEDTAFVRAQLSKPVTYDHPGPVSQRAKVLAELERRRAKREALWQ
jgi:hypothetical protein